MSDLKEAFKSLSLFDTVPQEILCQIIEKVGTPILIDDLDNLRSAYPKLSEQFNFCVAEIDFTNGVTFSLREYDEQRTVWNFSQHWQWAKLNKNYPGLRQYRIAVSDAQEGSKYNDVFKFLADPRARWLYVSIHPSSKREDFPLQDFYTALTTGVSKRIKRYGADFTVAIVIESYVDLPIGFVYQNGLLSFENVHQNAKLLTKNSRRSNADQSMDSNLTIQKRIIKAFQPVIQILGARSSKNLSELFEKYGTTLLKSVTKISLDVPITDKSEHFSNENESAFLRFLTEVHYNPYIDGSLSDVDDTVLWEELEIMNVIYPRITVMELPISVYDQPVYQRYFPNVTKFVYREQLEIDYHEQEAARFKRYLQRGLERLRHPVIDE